MKTRQLFFLTLFLGLMCECASASTVYISGDGSGDFNCDGIDDHVQINQALDYAANHMGTTVYLKGPFTYVINDTLLIGNNTLLEGDSNAVVKLKNNANWEMWKPLLSAISYNSKDIIIAGFKIDGNRGENTVSNPDRYHLLIKLTNCENISIYNMNLTNNNGDGARLVTCRNIGFYNNLVSNLGHDGLYAIKCSNVTAYNNSINCRWNSGLRVYNTNNVSLHDNIIYSDSPNGCGSGIEIEKYNSPLMNNIKIYNNTISNTGTSGIWLFGYGAYSGNTTHAHIYNNIIYNVGKSPTMIDKMGGINTDGWNALIENNVIDGTWVAGIRVHHVSGIQELNTDNINVTVRNNIITNTKAKLNELGYGIYNQIPDTHNFVLEYNCLYNNAGGNYNNTAAGMTDFYRNPLFVNNGSHDYHLKSKAGHWNGASWVLDSANSPCIDAGHPLSDYSNEPKPNGDRINIGAYGNTPYAEKSYYGFSAFHVGSLKSNFHIFS